MKTIVLTPFGAVTLLIKIRKQAIISGSLVPQSIAVPVSIFPTHSILVLRVSYQLIFSRNEHVKQATLKDQYSCIRKIRSETLFMVLKVVIDRVMF